MRHGAGTTRDHPAVSDLGVLCRGGWSGLCAHVLIDQAGPSITRPQGAPGEQAHSSALAVPWPCPGRALAVPPKPDEHLGAGGGLRRAAPQGPGLQPPRPADVPRHVEDPACWPSPCSGLTALPQVPLMGPPQKQEP